MPKKNLAKRELISSQQGFNPQPRYHKKVHNQFNQIIFVIIPIILGFYHV